MSQFSRRIKHPLPDRSIAQHQSLRAHPVSPGQFRTLGTCTTVYSTVQCPAGHRSTSRYGMVQRYNWTRARRNDFTPCQPGVQEARSPQPADLAPLAPLSLPTRGLKLAPFRFCSHCCLLVRFSLSQQLFSARCPSNGVLEQTCRKHVHSADGWRRSPNEAIP